MDSRSGARNEHQVVVTVTLTSYIHNTLFIIRTRFIFRPTLVLVKSEMKFYNSGQILQNTTNDIMPVQLILNSISTKDIQKTHKRKSLLSLGLPYNASLNLH